MKDGVILANAGHFDVEINKVDLNEISLSRKEVRSNIEQFILPSGRKINLLVDGRLVNLAAGDGHPAEIMDMSFALQALSAQYLVKHTGKLCNRLYSVPEDINFKVAELKLKSLGISYDSLTEKQKIYLNQ
jgi:adenosylhomocysteinase